MLQIRHSVVFMFMLSYCKITIKIDLQMILETLNIGCGKVLGVGTLRLL